MEALLIIFAELLLVCLMPLFSVVGAVLGAIFELFLLLFSTVFSGFVEKRRVRRARPPRKPLIPRKIVHWVAGVSAAIGVLGVVASYVLFQPILRYALDVAGERTGMSVAYDRASGSLLGGNVVLEGLELTRAHETGLAFDLAIDRLEADVALTSLLSDTPTLLLGAVEGMTGEITPPEPSEGEKGLPKERRPFRAELISASNVTLEITPRTATAYDIVITTAEVAPFRSHLAVFDLLFRSNMNAEIAGQTLLVETSTLAGDGRATRWAFEDVDAGQLKLVLPRAPLTWVDEGRVTVAVTDEWSLHDNFVDMDWRIATNGMALSVPETAGRGERMLAGGLARYVDRFGGDVDFQYQLDLDPEEMAALRAGDLEGFWRKVLSGVVGSDRDDVEETGAEDEGPGIMDRMRSLFDGNPAPE